MRSQFGGEARGRAYRDRLEQIAIENQARQDAADNEMRKAAMAQQGLIQKAQIDAAQKNMEAAMGNQASMMAQPQQQAGAAQPAGSPMQKESAMGQLASEGLPEYLKWASMGNTRRAEKIFNAQGAFKIRPDSTMVDKDGNVSFIDDETNQTITVPKTHVDRITGVPQPRATSPEEKAYMAAKTEMVGQPKPQSEIDVELKRSQIEANKAKAKEGKTLKITNKFQNDALEDYNASKMALEQAQKNYDEAVSENARQSSVPYLGKGFDKFSNWREDRAKNKLDVTRKIMEQQRNKVIKMGLLDESQSSQEQETQQTAPEQKPPAAPAKTGRGLVRSSTGAAVRLTPEKGMQTGRMVQKQTEPQTSIHAMESQGQGQKKPVTREIAQQFINQAKGDKAKARELAMQAGYSF